MSILKAIGLGLGIAAGLASLGQAQVGPTDYVAAWDFDEGSGTTLYDLSPNGFDGTVSGAQWIPGISGTALEFDGLDDFAAVADGAGPPALIGDLAEGTISLWFRFDGTPSMNEVYTLFYLGDGVGGGGHSGLIIEIGHFAPSRRLYFTIHTDDVFIPQCFDSGYNLTIGKWYHFCAVVGTGYNTGYLDGVEMIDRHYNYGGPTDDYFCEDVVDQQVLWFGRGPFAYVPTDQYHYGAIDEVRVYDRPLSGAEIASYYQTVMSCAAPATEVVRLGSPPNPAALLPGQTSGPVTGELWDPAIDHTMFLPGAVLDFLTVSSVPLNVPTPLGTLLCDPAKPGLVVTAPAPGLPFALPVPDSCSLVGIALVAQGGALEASGKILLTNALDLTLGSF